MSSSFEIGALCTDSALLALVTPREDGAPLAVLRDDWPAIAARLPLCGAILMRGFAVAGAEEFRNFVADLGQPLLSYEFGSTPRTQLGSGVYTSTEYPAHQTIPLHNEQSYTREWPLKIFFHCVQPAQQGGDTPIGDSRRIYRRIDAALRARFADKGLLYVRNYGNGFDVPWQQVFNTGERAVVEAYCRRHDIAWEWKSDGELRTRQRCQAVAEHPHTRERVWFNQAHLFHVSHLGDDLRDVLLDAVGEADLPRNVYYGDGTAIEDEALAQVRAVLAECEVRFPWRAGDVLLLDNMLTAHGRTPFSGPRRVVVAMTEAFSSSA